MATPEPFNLAVAKVTPSASKETVPVGTPAAPEVERLTVAVRVTSAGGVTEVGDAVRVVEVGALFSVTLRALEAEPL